MTESTATDISICQPIDGGGRPPRDRDSFLIKPLSMRDKNFEILERIIMSRLSFHIAVFPFIHWTDVGEQ